MNTNEYISLFSLDNIQLSELQENSDNNPQFKLRLRT